MLMWILTFQTNINHLIRFCSRGNEESKCKETSPSNKHFVTWYQKFKKISKVPDDVYAATLEELFHKVRIKLFNSSSSMTLQFRLKKVKQLSLKLTFISNRPYPKHSHINAKSRSRSAENGPQILSLRSCWVGVKLKETVKRGLK